jgi:2-polyprenyl-3-methyl-5-hydroxy-6-metoxy-1,4-benzoquinol methylase
MWRRSPFAMQRCTVCRQQFVSPRSIGFDSLYEEHHYFDGMNRTNRLAAAFRRVWFAGRHRRMRDAGARVGTLVEIGPSWGEFVADAQRRGFTVAASEFSEAAAEVVRSTRGIEVQAGAFDHRFFAERGMAPVDVVCLWDVIEHVPDPPAFLAEIAALCRPGSVVGFSCPDVGGPLARLMGRRWHTFKPDEHLWHFTAATIRRTWEEAGFDVVWLSSSPFRRANLLRFDCLTGVAVRR